MEAQYIYEIVALALLVAAALVFFVIPDRRERRRREAQVAALRPGDHVVTKNGLRAKVEEVDGDVAVVTVGPDRVKLEIALWGIESVEGAGQAAAAGRIVQRTAEKAR